MTLVNTDYAVNGAQESQTTDAMTELEDVIVMGVISELDAQVQQYGNELQDSDSQKQDYRAKEHVVDSLLGAPDTVIKNGDDLESEGKSLTVEQAEKLVEILKSLGRDFEATGIQIAIDQSKKSGEGGISIETSFLQEIKDGFADKVDSLNQSSELKMIRFQALMDARKQAFMMLSNMVNNNHQTMQAIIQNLKG
jgi:hypothetical protein